MTLRAVGLAALALAAPAGAQPAPWRAYFGNLHSHSGVSDGVERPATAFAYAKDAGVDFLCLSEHNHDTPPSRTTQAGLTEADGAAAAASGARFVGLLGQEFSTLSGGNHVNVFDVATQIPPALNNDYRTLFDQWLPEYQKKNPKRIVVAQFNHPEDAGSDYGRRAYRVKGDDGGTRVLENYQGDSDAFVKGVDPWVRTIAILSGPADTTLKSSTTLPLGEHRDFSTKSVNIWHKYLDLGLHLSPAADQDNHSRSWGNRTSARTGVWLPGVLSREEVLRALKANRAFATEDSNLALWFSVEGRPMGSRLARPADGQLEVEAVVRDRDEPDAEYWFQLYFDVLGDGEPPDVIEKSPGRFRDGQSFKVLVDDEQAGAVALLMRATQFRPDAGAQEAWSSPIWVEAPGSPGLGSSEEAGSEDGGTQWVGSRSTKVYHYPECKTARQLADPLTFTSPPSDRHLHHGCPK